MDINILLIEDNVGDAKLIEKYLRQQKIPGFFAEHTIIHVTSLEDAFKLIENTEFNVILSDLGLVETKGIDTFFKLYNFCSKIPIIVLTGLEDENVATEAIINGAQDYLPKDNLNSERLNRAIRYAIERKKIEEQLKRSEEKYKTVVELLPEIVFECDLNGKLIFCNQISFNKYKYEQEDLNDSLNVFNLIIPEDRNRAIENTKLVINGESQTGHEYTALRKDGKTFPIIIYSSPIIQNEIVVGVRGVIVDITERKRYEDSLKESEKRLSVAIQIAKLGVSDVWMNSKEGIINNEFKNIIGFASENESEIYNFWVERVHPDDKDFVEANFISLQSREIEHCEMEYRFLHPRNELIWIHMISQVIEWDKSKNPLRLFSIYKDVTLQKQLEDEKRIDELRSVALIELNAITDESLYDILQYALDKAQVITSSPQGYLAFLNDNESELNLYSWSLSMYDECLVKDKKTLFDVEKTGLWGEPIRQRKAILTNDYDEEKQYVKGIPDGHIKIKRHLGVPIFDGQKTVMLIGVANKEQPYNEKDIDQLTILMDGVWKIVKRKQAEDSLNENRLLLQTLIDAMPDIVCFKDGNGKWLQANMYDLKLFGLEGVNYQGMSDSELAPYSPFYKDAFLTCEQTDEVAWQKKEMSQGDEFIPLPDGTAKIFDIIKIPMFDDKDNRKGLVVVGRDITARKIIENALRLSEEKYRQLVLNISDAVFQLDKNGDIIYITPIIESIIGYTQTELIGANLLDYILHEDKQLLIENFNSVLEGQYIICIIRLNKKTGNSCWIRASLRPYFDDNVVVGMHGIITDISALKETEFALIKAKEKAEESNRLKSEFLANMSHELRTPLNSILGFCQLLLKYDFTKEEAIDNITIVFNSSRHLLKIINDLLDISLIEVGKDKIEKENFALKSLLDDIFHIYYPKLEKKNIQLLINIDEKVPTIISTDYTKVKQILINLVGNAFKFTEIGYISIEVKIIIQSSGLFDRKNYLLFSVKDTGIGIPNDKFEQIFDAFVQVNGTLTRPYGGTGLGLTINKRYVEMLGGNIWVESELNIGSTFYFTIEIEKAEEIKTKDEILQINSPSSMLNNKILLVEDDLSTIRLIKDICKKYNIPLTVALNGKECIELVKKEPPNLILMDIQLPVFRWDGNNKDTKK